MLQSGLCSTFLRPRKVSGSQIFPDPQSFLGGELRGVFFFLFQPDLRSFFFLFPFLPIQVLKMPAALRAIAPFLRTARSGLRSSSPLLNLQRQTRSPVLNLARSYAVFERSKPHVNIGREKLMEMMRSAGNADKML